jgi:hypothetical protein
MSTPSQPTNDKKQSVAEFLLEFAASIPKDVPAAELEKLPTGGAFNTLETFPHKLKNSPSPRAQQAAPLRTQNT